MSIIPIYAAIHARRKNAERAKRVKGTSPAHNSEGNKPKKSQAYQSEAERIFDSVFRFSFKSSEVYKAFMLMLNDHPEIATFLDQHAEEILEMIQQDQEDLKNQARELCPAMNPYVESHKELEKLGIKFDPKKYKATYPVFTENGVYTTGLINVDSNCFRGIILTPEILLSDENPYRKRLEDFQRDHPNTQEEIKKTKALIEKLRKNKLLLKLSASRRKKLEDAEEKLKNLEACAKTEASYADDANFYDNLSQDQKKMIVDHFIKRDIFVDSLKTFKEINEKMQRINPVNVQNPRADSGYKEYIIEIIKKIAEKSPNKKIYEDVVQFIELVAQTILTASDKQLKQICDYVPTETYGEGYIKPMLVIYLCQEIASRGKELLAEQELENPTPEDEGDEND